jgi:hypothetical protein
MRHGYSNSNTGIIRGASLQYSGMRVKLAGGISRQSVDITTSSAGNPQVMAYRVHTKPVPSTRETFPYLAGTVSVSGWVIGGLASWYTLQPTTVSSKAQNWNYSLAMMRVFNNHIGEWHFAHETALRSVSKGGAGFAISRGHQTRVTFQGYKAGTGGRLRLMVMHRHFSPDWTAVRGQLIGDRLDQGNESGWFIVWQWSRRGWKVRGYLDSYQQCENKEIASWPRDGWESGLSFKGRWRTLETTVYYRQREVAAILSSRNSAGLDILHKQIEVTHYARCAVSYTPFSNLRLRLMTALSYPGTHDISQGGETFGGSLRYRTSPGVVYSMGAHLFNIASWDHRLYIYEDGLPGEFNFHVLSGQGTRVHARIVLPIGDSSIALRAAQKWWHQNRSQEPLQSATQIGLQMDIAL